MRIDSKERSLVFQDLGVLEYRQALELQTRARTRKMEDPALPDQLFFVEHPPVFTFGKNGGRENLIVSNDFLNQNNVAMVQTDRGGNVTYHGPGQAVLYPVIDLEKAKIGVADFVNGLEEIMIQTAGKLGVMAERNPKNHGIWVGPAKIGSVGLSIKKGVSIHGLALNIFPDLTPFSWINPCGMENVPITSIKEVLDADPDNNQRIDLPNMSMEMVKNHLITDFCCLFNFKRIQESTHV